MSAPASVGARRHDAIDAFAAFMMIGLTLSWGLNQVAIKIVNGGFNPMFGLLLRSVIAAVLVYLWCRWRRIPVFVKDGSLLPGLLAGLLFGLEFIVLFFGIDLTTAGRGSLMLNTMPFWVLLGGHFLLGEKITARRVFGLLLAFGGVALVFSDGLAGHGASTLVGDLMCLLAGLLWALTVIVVKQSRLTEISPEKTLLYQLVVSIPLALPLVPYGGPILREVSAQVVGALLFHSVYVVSFTFVLWFWLMKRYPASGLSSFAFLTPAFGVLGSAVLLGEKLTGHIVLALCLIAVGLIIVNRPARRIVPA